jgi:hypothetical protein
MHRQSTRLSARLPRPLRRVAAPFERQGIVATYELHDRLLANRTARRLHTQRPPALDEVQQRILSELDTSGYAALPFAELVTDDSLCERIENQGAAFIAATEAGLARETEGEADVGLRRRRGKEFLVRANSFDGVRLGPDDAWLQACLSTRLLDVANAYLGLWSKLSYVDLWYTAPQPASADRVASQLWHFDFDDKHLLKAFLYLSDVGEGAGPFEYVAGSQPGGQYHQVRPWKPMAYGRVPEEDVSRQVPATAVKTFAAPRGTLILCNTSGLHRGGFATEAPRVLATATYCSPASLKALSIRNFVAGDSPVEDGAPAARYAVE